MSETALEFQRTPEEAYAAYLSHMRERSADAERMAEQSWCDAVHAEIAALRAEQATEYIARAPEARRLANVAKQRAYNMAAYAEKITQAARDASECAA